eukprot:XP_011683223.1 PREDICTED: uncharacterized protein LOC105447170 [Strongylocentrotus purpuratus]
MEGEHKTATPDEVEVTTNGVDTGKVITAQPIPEDPSEHEPEVEKKRSNMVGRGEYVHTTKVTSTSTHRWDDRCASCNCGTGGDAQCCEILFACLLCHCIFRRKARRWLRRLSVGKNILWIIK